MSANLSVKNVPDDIVRALQSRAIRNQRSLQEELLDILRQAARGHDPLTIDDLLAHAQRQKPGLDETVSKVHSSQSAKHQRAARAFEDLIGGPDDSEAES